MLNAEGVCDPKDAARREKRRLATLHVGNIQQQAKRETFAEPADKSGVEKRKPEVVIADTTLSFPKYSKNSLQNYLLKLIVHYSILNENSVSVKNEKIKDQKVFPVLLQKEIQETERISRNSLVAFQYFKKESCCCCSYLVLKFAQLLLACAWLGDFTGTERICV